MLCVFILAIFVITFKSLDKKFMLLISLKVNLACCIGGAILELCPIIRKKPDIIWTQENKEMKSNVLRRARIESFIRMFNIIFDFYRVGHSL